MEERRRHQRNAITFPATITFPGGDAPVRGTCRDLSLGGLYLSTEARPVAGSVVELTATFPGSREPVNLQLTVRWLGHDGMGLQFGAVGERQRAAITGALRLAVPTRSVPPRAGGSRVGVAFLLGVLVAAVGIGFVSMRFGPAFMSRLTGQPAAPTPQAPATSSSAAIVPDHCTVPIAPSLDVAPAPPFPRSSENRPTAASAPAPQPLSSVSAPPAASSSPPTAALAASAGPATPPPAASRPASPAQGEPAADPSACMAAMFPPDTFKTPPDLAFVCSEPDPRNAATHMRVKLVVGSAGKLTEATNEWSRLGWYELAVLGILRCSCCPAPSSFSLPEPAQGCDALPPLLDRVGDAVKSRSGVQDAVKDFEQAAVCAHAAKTSAYHYAAGPFSGSQVAFAAFLSRNTR